MKINHSYLPIQIKTPSYSLSIIRDSNRWKIHGETKNVPVNTKNLPYTYTLLRQYVPKILMSTCFNDDQLPFSQELYNTELGHLLEHILLEFLCEEKLDHGELNAAFDGVTTWYKDSPQKFIISIPIGPGDEQYLSGALPKGLYVFDLILQSPQLNQPKIGDVSPNKQIFLPSYDEIPRYRKIATS